ncbi:hypothetical protein [Nocardia sp. BMG111209]|uniref:hypothetical protein n=1 Tax=Nocardia sp. BMG111209 TaxID=1160137 RepID=UPI00036207A1|nr:hypothetical protein [Nocardia sp. BMG111209]
MSAKVVQVSAAAAIVLSLGLIAAPAASAASVPASAGTSATAVDGSVTACLNIPVPPVSISICL